MEASDKRLLDFRYIVRLALALTAAFWLGVLIQRAGSPVSELRDLPFFLVVAGAGWYLPRLDRWPPWLTAFSHGAAAMWITLAVSAVALGVAGREDLGERLITCGVLAPVFFGLLAGFGLPAVRRFRLK